MKKGTGIILALIVALLIGIVGFGGYYIVNQEKKMSSIEKKIDGLSDGTNNIDTDEKNEDKNNKYDEAKIANEAISRKLKDRAWLVTIFQDMYAYVEEHDGDEDYKPEYNFAKLNTSTNSPVYVIEYEGNIILVSYKNGAVITSSDMIHAYYSLRIDLNKGIIRVDALEDSNYGPAEMKPYLYEIVDNNFKPILNYKIGPDGINYVYYYKESECTEEEYSKYVSQYKQGYNFVSIETKLTDENIDKYVK